MKKTLMVCAAMFTLVAMTACKSGTREKAVAEPPFADTIPICFETDWGHTGAGGIFCSVEINGLKVDTVLVDNGYYYSGISPDMVRKLKMTYTAIESTPTATAFEPDVYVDTCITCIADNLYIKPGHTVLQLDTIYITKWHEIAGKPSCKAVLGRDFFEKYIVNIDIQHKYMAWSNHLPLTIDRYLAIPMYYLGDSICPNYRIIKADGFKGKDGNPLVARVFLDLGNSIPRASFDASFLKQVDQNFSQIDTATLAWLILSTIGSAVDSIDFPVEHMDDSHCVDAKMPGSLLPDWDGLNGDILLGTDFFRHFNVIFDYKNNMLYLKRNE